MRDEDKEADPEVQYIQMKKKVNLRKACLAHYYNTYEHCTFQQKLSKQNARIIKNKKKLIITKCKLFFACDILFCSLQFLFCIEDLSILLHI